MAMKWIYIIPFEMPDNVLIRVEDLPSYRGKLGKINDNIGVKITSVIPRPETQKSEFQLLQRKNKSTS